MVSVMHKTHYYFLEAPETQSVNKQFSLTGNTKTEAK